ncbi:MAG TPA: glycosyltransferase [Thermoanaerobaculia bacterium]|nr:glycosyltransferase [Thermoanaerobaculia bacterium]
MRITYVLASAELNGGHRVAFQHAELLLRAGVEVTVAAPAPRPAWARWRGGYRDLCAGPPRLPSQDLVVGTFWTTLSLARELAAGPVAHFCQGYEGDLEHLAGQLPQIEEAYRRPLPALVVSPHLGELLRDRFARESAWAPPPLDPRFRPSRLPRRGPRSRPWVAVPGIFEAEVKGVRLALAAARRLREEGVEARVLRSSFRPLVAEERALLAPQRYLCAVPPSRVARELRRCDLLLFGSGPAEGFGLPLLEAMASGVPAVAFAVPSVSGFASGAVSLAPFGEVERLAAAALDLLRDAGSWRRARATGLEAARRFRPEEVAPRLLEAVRWAASWTPAAAPA